MAESGRTAQRILIKALALYPDERDYMWWVVPPKATIKRSGLLLSCDNGRPAPFVPLVAFAEVQAAEHAGASCLLTHGVQRVRTHLSGDRRRMISLYRASDAKSVRLALHDASMPVERIWAFRLFRG